MTQASAQASLNSSRLVRFITSLSVSDAEQSNRNFGDRIGSLIDFSDSIILSAAHGELPGLQFEKRTETGDNVREEFLKVRAALVESIVKSTTVGAGGTRIKLPRLELEEGQTIESLIDYEPYHRFYASHQRDMDFKLKALRQFIRDEASGFSPKLAQLTVLDTALDDTLSMHTRRFFNSIPRLLGKRYKFLSSSYREQLTDPEEDNCEYWIANGGWLEQFLKEIQGVLLAELEVRLQPILGLVEALNEEVNLNQ